MNESESSTMIRDLIAVRSRSLIIKSNALVPVNDLGVRIQTNEEKLTQEESLSNCIHDAFELGINARKNRPAELIARFIDTLLRSKAENMADLNDALSLFRYLHGKDIFEAFYKRDLAKRLLTHRSASIDAERMMLAKLRDECGAAFTSKLEGMFKDIDVSDDLVREYSGSMSKDDTDMSVVVLTQSFWPTYPSIIVNIPKDVRRFSCV